MLAYTVNVDGSIDETPIWDAGVKVSSQNYDSGREIITFNDAADVIPGGDIEGQGIAFRFPGDYNTPNNLSEFNNAQISSLMTNAPYPVSTTQTTEIASNAAYGQGITNYLRGDTVNEGVGLGFRNRSSALGDIVNSDPRFVGAPNFQYPDAIQSRSYADFIDHYKDRVGIVYVGANDGMLHAFNEAQGNELLAYVPSQIYDKLNELSRMNYSHRYLVDAGPTIVDAFLPNKTDPISGGSGAWRSVLTAGLGGGGQGIYSLDVTDPARFDEINAAELVLWEFDDSDDADLGYTYGRPQIAKLANGRWAAVFGNGYNNTTADGQVSSTGNAVLYIVDIESGELIRKIDTLAGSTTTPNGLATPLLVDENADLVVDYIYAGDLLGNLWKFDVSDSNDANWDIAYSQAGVGIPLFETAQNQAITTQPQAAFHPDGRSGFMIYFGTGKYLEVTDNESINQPLQAFYGVWDKNETTLNVFDGSDLLSQTIDNQYVKEFDTDADGVDDTEYTLRDVSSNTIDFDSHMGWKIDLSPVLIEGVSNSNNFGERQISNAIVRDGKVIFTTVVPSQIECEYGGMSFIMELNYRNGGALAYPAFDLNKDGNYDAIDGQASGRASNAGLMPTVSILSNGAENIAFGSGASGDIDIIELSAGNEAYGRQSWRQLE
ncbi:MAG: hypothetical protein COC19_04235 [SAR86 cluster bacterium]|uniref:PilY1 beta-propeller domain-containing protein n=1 Tax=SAR86 cluster bacterium TaxID=2030880 RepID=A0A2A4MPZ2_9GAMM|nr:MAG: hypothetical protein COC19_04235 [SAR86 cluster bacterium]